MLFFPNVSTKWYEWYNVKHEFVILSGARNCWQFVKLVAPAININFFTQFFAHFPRALVATNHPHPRLVALAARGGGERSLARAFGFRCGRRGEQGWRRRRKGGGGDAPRFPPIWRRRRIDQYAKLWNTREEGKNCLFVSLLYSLLKKLSKMEQEIQLVDIF